MPIRTLRDLLNRPLNESSSSSFSGTGNRLGGIERLNDNDISSRSRFEEFLEEQRRYIEENTSSSNEVDLPNLDDSLEIASDSSDFNSIFEIVQSISNRITNGEISLGDNPMSVSIIQLIQDYSGNNPHIASLIENLSNQHVNSPILNQLWSGDWRNITLGTLYDNLCDIPLVNLPYIEYGIVPLKLITFGFMYRLLVRTFVRNYIPHTQFNEPNNRLLRISNLKVRNYGMAVVCLLVAPMSAVVCSNFTNSVLSESVYLKIGSNNVSSVSADKLSWLPFIFTFAPSSYFSYLKSKNKKSFKVRGATKIITENKDEPIQKKNFFKKGFKWLVILILLYLQLKYNWMSEYFVFYATNKYVIEMCLFYIEILGICLALVSFSLAIFILSIKSDIEIDLSSLRIPYLRQFLEDLISVRNEKELSYTENMRKMMIGLFKLTLFILFALPLFYYIIT